MRLTIILAIFSFALSCHAQNPVTPHGVKLSVSPCVDSDIDSYAFFRSSVSGGPYTQIATVGTSTPITYLDPVPSGTVDGKYFYISQCHSISGGWSKPSLEVSPTGTVPKGTNNGNAPVATALPQ